MTSRNRDTSSLEILNHWAKIDWAQVKGSTLRLRRRIFQAKVAGKEISKWSKITKVAL